MEREARLVTGGVFMGLVSEADGGIFPKLKEGKTKRKMGGAGVLV